jgi:hypothetical protein
MDELAGLLETWAPGAGIAGLITLFVLLIFTGKLIPRTFVDSLIADKDKQIAAVWEAYEAERTARVELGAQVGEMLEQGRTTIHLLREIQRPGVRQ